MNAIQTKTMAPKQTTAHLDWRTMLKAADDTPQAMLDALDTYFEAFAQPLRRDDDESKEMLCIECEKPLTGLTSVFFGGGFVWGLAHGEGYCAGCKWPARGHHFIKYPDGTDLATLRNVVLQYHPDYVERRSALASQTGSRT